MAPFAPAFFPAIFSPSHAPASLPNILDTPRPKSFGLDAPGVVKVPGRGLGFATNNWLGKSATRALLSPFLAVFRDWHGP
jgi:hypothetical protein